MHFFFDLLGAWQFPTVDEIFLKGKFQLRWMAARYEFTDKKKLPATFRRAIKFWLPSLVTFWVS